MPYQSEPPPSEPPKAGERTLDLLERKRMAFAEGVLAGMLAGIVLSGVSLLLWVVFIRGVS